MSKKKLKNHQWTEVAVTDFINELRLFECDRESEEFAIRARIFIGAVVECKTKSDSVYDKMGLELMRTIIDCLKSFEPSKGNFMHYLNASLKNAKNQYCRDKERQEVPYSLPKKQSKAEKKLFHWLKEHDWPYLTNQAMEELSEQFDVDKKIIENAYQIEAARKAESCYINDDDEAVSIEIADTEQGFSSLENEDVLDALCRFLVQYINEHPKKAILWSAIMTNEICSVVLSVYNQEEQRRKLAILEKWNVFHEEVYQKCMKKTECKLQGQELAQLLEKDNATISREKSSFHEYFRNTLKKG